VRSLITRVDGLASPDENVADLPLPAPGQGLEAGLLAAGVQGHGETHRTVDGSAAGGVEQPVHLRVRGRGVPVKASSTSPGHELLLAIARSLTTVRTDHVSDPPRNAGGGPPSGALKRHCSPRPKNRHKAGNPSPNGVRASPRQPKLTTVYVLEIEASDQVNSSVENRHRRRCHRLCVWRTPWQLHHGAGFVSRVKPLWGKGPGRTSKSPF
jgi:hypothetical protein